MKKKPKKNKSIVTTILGSGTMRRLLEAVVNIFDVFHVFFSHFYPDHAGELVPFLFANKYPECGPTKSIKQYCKTYAGPLVQDLLSIKLELYE